MFKDTNATHPKIGDYWISCFEKPKILCKFCRLFYWNIVCKANASPTCFLRFMERFLNQINNFFVDLRFVLPLKINLDWETCPINVKICLARWGREKKKRESEFACFRPRYDIVKTERFGVVRLLWTKKMCILDWNETQKNNEINSGQFQKYCEMWVDSIHENYVLDRDIDRHDSFKKNVFKLNIKIIKWTRVETH